MDITPITVETTTTTIETAATVETTTGMETPANQNPNFWLPKDWPPHDWRQWAEEPWTYLLDRPREAGPIICVSRGKLLVIAAGNVSDYPTVYSSLSLLISCVACRLH